MTGVPVSSFNTGQTFAELQRMVYSVASAGTLDYLATLQAYAGGYVDPTTGHPYPTYDPSKLLETASGRSTWLGDGASDEAREHQIAQVLESLGWRLAAVSGPTGIQRSASELGSVRQGCTGSSISAELQAEWKALYQQAQTSAPDLGAGAGYSSSWIQVSGSAEVTLGRTVVSLFPTKVAAAAPLPNVPIDAARLTIDNYSGGFNTGYLVSGNIGKISVVARRVAAGTSPTPSDWDFSGTTIGTIGPQPDGRSGSALRPNPGTGTPTPRIDLPLGLLLAPTSTKSQPLLEPGIEVRLTGEEPPPGFPPTTNLDNCSDPYVVESAAGWTGSQYEIIYHEAFPPLGAGTVHVGTAKVDLSAALSRLARELRSQVFDLTRTRESLAAELPGLRDRVAKAGAALAGLDQKIGVLTGEVAKTQVVANQVLAAQRASRAAATAAKRDSLDREMRFLQVEILGAIQSLSSSTVVDALVAHYDKDEAELAALERSLAGKEKTADGLDAQWLVRLRTLQNELAALKRQAAQQEAERWKAADLLGNDNTSIGEIDGKLVALGAKLDGLDLGLKSVTVAADGKKVFEAELDRKIPELGALDQKIYDMQQALGVLYEDRIDAKNAFLSAEQESSDALDNVTNTILSASYKKAGVDFAYNAWDVISAGRKGGLIGASAETLKKVAETIVKEGPPWNWFSARNAGGPEANAGEFNDFDQQYLTGLKESFGAGKVLKIAGERLVKQEVSKPVKDYVNQKLMSELFQKVYGLQLTPESTEAAPFWNPVERYRQFIKAFGDREGQLKNLQKGTSLNPFSGLKDIFKAKDIKTFAGKLESSPGFDLIGGFVKDLSKNLAKAYLDGAEQLAWSDYFTKEMIARSYFPLWQMAATKFWEAEDDLQHLLDQKAELVAKGYNPETGVRIIQDDTFSSNATLTITVTSANPSRGSAVQLDAVVAGKKASAAGTYRYTIPANGLEPTASGLGLVLDGH